MCGDTRCHSCGPAQGNHYCPNCGQWDEDGGCVDPELCAAALRADDEQMYADFQEDERIAKEYQAWRADRIKKGDTDV